jgi:phosphate/sulfate permease
MVAVNSRTLAVIPVAWVISILGSGALAYALMAASTALR